MGHKDSTYFRYLATTGAEYLGITADDIEAYDLPSDKLTPKDIEALKAELSVQDFLLEYGKTRLI